MKANPTSGEAPTAGTVEASNQNENDQDNVIMVILPQSINQWGDQPACEAASPDDFDIVVVAQAADAIASAAAASRDQAQTPSVVFNLVEHPSAVLVKQFRLVNGEVVKDTDVRARPGRIPPGCTVSTVTCSLAEYVHKVHDGGSCQYALPANVELGTGNALGIKGAAVDRSAATMKFEGGRPAVVTFDHDKAAGDAGLETPEQLWSVLVAQFPEAFEGAARAMYYSSSSFIEFPDRGSFSEARGHHTAVAVEDAGDIPRFSEALFKRLCLAGYGYIFITKDGRQLPRTVFDRKVLEPQQPVFAGGAYCRDGLSQRRPTPIICEGGYVRTKAVKTLTADEGRAYAEWEANAKAAAQAEASKVRLAYQQREVDRLVGEQGLSIERARIAVESRLAGTLVGSDTLQFAEHGHVGVAEALANPARFDGASLHDPLELDYGGSSTAIFYANQSTGEPLVFSQAHGGRTFFLRYDEPTLAARLRGMSAEDVAASWMRLAVQAALPDDAVGRVLQDVKKITGTPLGDLRSALKAQRMALQRRQQDAAPDPASVVAGRLIEQRYTTGSARTLIFTETKAFYRYTGTHWRVLAAPVLAGELQEVAQGMWSEVGELFAAQGKAAPSMSGLVGSAMSLLEGMLVRAGDPLRFNAQRPNVLNMSNGELWLGDSGPELRPHDPDSYLTSCSGIVYDEAADAPTFAHALRGMLSHPGGRPMVDQDEMVRHVEELLGYAAQSGRWLKTFYLWTGPGDNGKTRLSRLLELILGQDAIAFDRLSGVSEEASRFAASKLVGKQVLIDDDAEHEYLLPDGLLKKIAEAKPLTAERKFEGAFTFVAQVVPIILANSWPRSRDLSRGMQTRAQVLYLPRSFKRAEECASDDPDRQRPELWETVYAKELAGVVNVLVRAVYRLKERGSFLQPESAKRAFESWLSDANVVSRFLNETCDRTGRPDRAGTTTSWLHKAFGLWADENGVAAAHRPQLNKLRGRIESLGFAVKHSNKGAAVYGLELKREWLARVEANCRFDDSPLEAVASVAAQVEYDELIAKFGDLA